MEGDAGGHHRHAIARASCTTLSPPTAKASSRSYSTGVLGQVRRQLHALLGRDGVGRIWASFAPGFCGRTRRRAGPLLEAVDLGAMSVRL
jgi:hypothetical protein